MRWLVRVACGLQQQCGPRVWRPVEAAAGAAWREAAAAVARPGGRGGTCGGARWRSGGWRLQLARLRRPSVAPDTRGTPHPPRAPGPGHRSCSTTETHHGEQSKQ